MLPIQPRYLSLHELLSKRIFSIPEYQRAYSWGTEQRSELFEDVRTAFRKGGGSGHFMAAVMCLRKETKTIGTTDYECLEIVDGQQRLTTLVILLKAIALRLKDLEDIDRKEKDQLNELLVKSGVNNSSALLLLQTNHDSSHFFSNFLREGKCTISSAAKTIADRELVRAITECIKFVSDWETREHSVVPLLAILKNRLFFLMHEIGDEKSVYTIFEVINSRGLPVSWLDRLKSNLMGAAFNLDDADKSGVIKELHNVWRDMYSCIGLRQGLSTESLRFAATLRSKSAPSRPLSEEDSVTLFRSMATDSKSILSIAHFLLQVTQACDRVHANVRQQAVTRVAQARLVAAAIELRDDLQASDKRDLLRLWENVSFRIYGMYGQDARRRVGDYVRLGWRMINEGMEPKAIKGELSKIGADFPIEEAVEQLRDTNCYWDWQQELRYFLFRYEEFLVNKKRGELSNDKWEMIWAASASDSIEHIAPQSKTPEATANRLGNLLLLTPKMNSELSDKPPNIKKDSYRKTGLLIAHEVADLIAQGRGWDAKAIDAREKELLDWAVKEWAD